MNSYCCIICFIDHMIKIEKKIICEVHYAFTITVAILAQESFAEKLHLSCCSVTAP
jgi:hypothetical protein